MHTARQLKASDFLVIQDGQPATREDLLSDWSLHDRLGVVMNEAFGAVGATHLIQLAITAFYDARPSRRAGRPDGQDPDAVYPEIYLFHVGGSYGDHSALDFWPARKEVRVPRSPLAVLDAINDRAITRLLVPDGPVASVEHEWKEPAAARDRVASAFAYSPDGNVSDPVWEIRGLKRSTERNVELILDPTKRFSGVAQRQTAGRAQLADPRRVWQLRAEDRRDEARAGIELAQRRRAAIRGSDGLARETYRPVTVDQALCMLV